MARQILQILLNSLMCMNITQRPSFMPFALPDQWTELRSSKKLMIDIQTDASDAVQSVAEGVAAAVSSTETEFSSEK